MFHLMFVYTVNPPLSIPLLSDTSVHVRKIECHLCVAINPTPAAYPVFCPVHRGPDKRGLTV